MTAPLAAGSADTAAGTTQVLPAAAPRPSRTALPAQTTLHERAAGAPPRPRPVSGARASDVMAVLGALAAALGITWLLFTELAPFSGALGAFVVAFLAFVAVYAVLVSMDESSQAVRDRVASVVIHGLAALLLTGLVFVIVYVFYRGSGALAHANFYVDDMSVTGPLDPLTHGGIAHGIAGTLEQITISLIITIPLGLTCAVFLNEFRGPAVRFVRTIVEAMTALPSIVAGLFIFTTYILALGRPKSGLAAALALSIMMLPIIIRASDVVIRLVPSSLREASLAMGAGQWRTVWHVVLPTARSGLATAIILGTARGIGETSPVLLTAGFTQDMNLDPRQHPQVSLPLLVFQMFSSPEEAMRTRAFGAASVLLVLVLGLFLIARTIGGRGPGNLTPRQLRRRDRQSAQDRERMGNRGRRFAVLGLGAVVAASVVAGGAAGPASAATYTRISGAGSTWSANAIQQWTSNVRASGMVVDYASTGSSDGRQQFKNDTVDFGVSEIPYGLTDGGVYDDPPKRPFAYIPIVAGGTSFMYNLKIAGKRVTQLRLSGENIAKIFTGVITSWADPAIKADNPGLNLPARKIVPVVRSDGSGTTAQFSRYLATRYQSLWDAYCRKAGRSTPCGITSQYPTVNGSGFVAQAGSVNVAGYVAQSTGEVAITYVEYSYALNAGFPVVKLLNQAGYYVEPTARNVAVGLLKATINKDTRSLNYLTQNLDGVYANPDPRAYPMSSYSYMIIPTGPDGQGAFTNAKGYTLAAFADYFLCQGQQKADILGYSPLPLNLVQAGFEQIRKIPGADVGSIDLKSCHNPTFSTNGSNTLAASAPYPPSCDKKGAHQCGTAVAGGGSGSGSGGGGGSGSGGGSGGGSGSGGSGSGGGNSGSGGATGGGGGGATGGGGTGTGAGTGQGTTAGTGGGAGDSSGGTATGNGPAVDADTGQVVAGGSSDAGLTNVAGTTVPLSADYTQGGTRTVLMVLAVLLLLGVCLGPPVLARASQRGREQGR